MPRVRDASAYRVGTATASRVYNGATLLWPPVTVTPPALRSSSAAPGATSGTSFTVTLPAGWQAGDTVVLVASTNLAAPTLGFSAGVDSFTVLAGAAGRLQVIRMVPTSGATTATLTSSSSGFVGWWCGAWTGANPARIAAIYNSIGSSTTAAVEIPDLPLGYTATGYEVAVVAAGVNSTATWAAQPDQVYASTSGNGTLQIRSVRLSAGTTTVTTSASNRGLEGTARNESAAVFVLAPA